MISSYNLAIFFGALEFVQTIISRNLFSYQTEILMATVTTFPFDFFRGKQTNLLRFWGLLF